MWDLASLTYWHWWILAVTLLAFEALLPGAIFLWLGLAGIGTGLLVVVLPGLDWQWQFISFALFAIASLMLWRGYHRRHPVTTNAPLLNQRGRQYIGRSFTLREPIVNGVGKIQVDDSTWKVYGPDCPAGTIVVATGVDGAILKVDLKAATLS